MQPCPKPTAKVKTRKKPKGKSDVMKLIEKIDKIDSDICLIENKFVCMCCGGQAKFLHHYFHKSNYGVLRFEPNNHIPVCWSCHEFKIHTKADTEQLRTDLIEKIGQNGFDDMVERGRGLAERSMPYLRACLSIKQSCLLHAVERADSSTLSMMSTAAVKRLESVKKKFNLK